jgi:hypothetical protein
MLRATQIHAQYAVVVALALGLAACGSDANTGVGSGGAAGKTGAGGSAGKAGAGKAGGAGSGAGGSAGGDAGGRAGASASGGTGGVAGDATTTGGGAGVGGFAGVGGGAGIGGRASTGGGAGVGNSGVGGDVSLGGSVGVGGNAGIGGDGVTGGGAGIGASAGASGVAGVGGDMSVGGGAGSGTSGASGAGGTSSLCTCVNGTCDLQSACVCNPGSTGLTCDTCDMGFFGATCSACPACAHGTCDSGSTGRGTCACAPGWTGKLCNESVWGNGSDGVLSVSGVTNLATDNSGTRTCADGGDAVGYSVTLLDASTATLATAPAAGCLAPGDEVLLINLQGTAADFVNVGTYETLRVAAIALDSITFTQAKIHFYGTGSGDDMNIGTSPTTQRVMLQRVPNYLNVNVSALASLTGSSWNGVQGGVVFFRASAAVNIDGTLSMSGKGFSGGPNTTTVNTNGSQGESFNGLGTRFAPANVGAGGGGIGDGHGCVDYGTSGGGGGYGDPGSVGSHRCSGAGGGVYGDPRLKRLLLGSGGGSGGTDNFLGDNPPGGFGGRGGGIIVIATQQLNVTGSVIAAGAAGQGDPTPSCNGGSRTSCWDYSGPGGAGSGGSILFNAVQAALGADLVTARGGLGGRGNPSGFGGNGGAGRIALRSPSTLTGTTVPLASTD